MRGPQPEGLPPSHKGIYPSLEGRNGGRGGGERRENEYIHVCVSVYVCVCPRKAGGEGGTLFPFMVMLKKESSETILSNAFDQRQERLKLFLVLLEQ